MVAGVEWWRENILAKNNSNLGVVVHYVVASGLVNPYLTNGFSHHYHLDDSTFSFRGVRSDFFKFYPMF